MIYRWKANTGQEIDIERKVSDYNLPPTQDEVANLDLSEKELTKITSWTRILIGGSLTINFGLKGKYNSQS